MTVSAAVTALASLAFSASAPGQEAVHQIGPVNVLGPGPDRLVTGLGAFNIGPTTGHGPHAHSTPPMAEFEYRFGWKPDFLGKAIGPAAGVLANTEGGVYGYVGVYADLPVGNFVITPLAGAGGYHEGDGKDLGGVFQFRLAFNAAYEFSGGTRLGVRFGHLSNAAIHAENPGENEILLVLDVPLR
jgi:hypothetical protein